MYKASTKNDKELLGAAPPVWRDFYIWVMGWHAEAQHAGTQHALKQAPLGES